MATLQRNSFLPIAKYGLVGCAVGTGVGMLWGATNRMTKSLAISGKFDDDLSPQYVNEKNDPHVFRIFLELQRYRELSAEMDACYRQSLDSIDKLLCLYEQLHTNGVPPLPNREDAKMAASYAAEVRHYVERIDVEVGKGNDPRSRLHLRNLCEELDESMVRYINNIIGMCERHERQERQQPNYKRGV
jgi:hypothetical protein